MENLERIAKNLKEKVDRLRETEIIQGERGDNFYAPGISYSRFTKAMKYKKVLLKDFEGKTLDDIYSGREIETEKGKFYQISHQENFVVGNLNNNWRERLLANLKLIYGIGPKTENKLKKEGFKNIRDLTTHPRYGEEAKQFLHLLKNNKRKKIYSWLRYWLPVSHPDGLCLTGLSNPEELLFFDLESMGLFSRPLVLLGLGEPKGENLTIKQYLIRNIPEEVAALRRAVENFTDNRLLVTYNGKRFDCNYIEERMGYYGQKINIDLPHLDLLFHARRAWGDQLSDCRLETVEKKILNTHRDLDIPSALVPDFYNTYLEEGSIGPLIPIIEHNKQDILSLAQLLTTLCNLSD